MKDDVKLELMKIIEGYQLLTNELFESLHAMDEKSENLADLYFRIGNLALISSGLQQAVSILKEV